MAVLAHPGRIEADDERPRRLGFSLARPRDQRRRYEAVVAGELKRLGCVAPILLLEQGLVLELGDLLPPPRHLRIVEPMERRIFAFLVGPWHLILRSSKQSALADCLLRLEG